MRPIIRPDMSEPQPQPEPAARPQGVRLVVDFAAGRIVGAEDVPDQDAGADGTTEPPASAAA